MPIGVRVFTSGDLDECTVLFNRVVSEPPWSDRWPSHEAARAYLEEIVDTPRFRGWVAVDGQGAIVGYALGNLTRWWRGDELYLKELGVDTRLHRRGIGRHLMERVRAEMRSEGVGDIMLLTMPDSPAESFYRALGYHQVDGIIMMARDTGDEG